MGQIADAQAEITLSLRRVLAGYVEEMGGPEAFGRELAHMTKDPEVNVASRVALANNVTRLMGSHGETENASDLLDDEQITTRMKQVDDALRS